MSDASGDVQLDKMVAETQELIDQANGAAANLREILKSFGCNDADTVRRLLDSGECPSNLKRSTKSWLMRNVAFSCRITSRLARLNTTEAE